MGSTNSGLFNGTAGSRNSSRHRSPEVMQGKVKGWAEKEISRLEGISKNQRRDFNTASVVYDAESGKYYYGRNNGIEIKNDLKNEKLFGENGVLPKQSMNRYSIGNCAEVDAINQALNAGAKLENLSLSTIHTYKGHVGELKEACENCTFAFKNRIKENHSGWKF